MTARTAYTVPVCLLLLTTNAFAGDVVDLAASLIGRPYVWGAEGPRSFDCSGLVQYVFQEHGIDLPRRAVSQSKVGNPSRRLQRGDLVFFSSDTRKSLVTHVGIYEGRGIMIDASKRHGRVRRDNLSEEYWEDRFMFARRINGDIITRRDDPDEAPEPVTRRPRRPERSGRTETTIRVLEGLAEVLLRRPRR
jgi:hypothetical protein